VRKVLLLHSCEPQEFIFNDIIEDCVVSILRRFSAPIRIEYENLPNEDLTFQLAYDSDSFCQWEAGQLLASRIILDLTEKV
jgi:aminopeptidase N